MRALPRWSLLFVAVIWLCFFTRGLFYCSFVPLWEGYDEWAHFAYVEQLATTGDFLVRRDQPVSREVQASLQLAPVPWPLRGMPNPSVTEDDYWRLSPEQRVERRWQLSTIPHSWSRQPGLSGLRIYEALQPPLYYWLLSLPDRIIRNRSLVDRVFLMRYISLIIASFSVPLVFLVTYRVVGSYKVALGAAALLTAMPELMVNVCRVGNECLGIVLCSWMVLLCLDLAEDVVPRRTGILAGIALGLGLITKAYFLTTVAALGALYMWRIWTAKERRAVVHHALVTFGSALLIGGWWYMYNRVTTRTWSGLNESIMLDQYTSRQFLYGIGHVQWGRAVDSILLSHVWFGGWSALVVRSWMYHVLFMVAAIAAAGVISLLWRSTAARRSYMYPLLAVYGCFWVGQLYNVLLLFLSKGASTSMGWYMYCVVAAEISLLVVGLHSLVPMRGRPWMLSVVILCLAALDLYTVHFVSIPYYTGLIAHRPNGSVAAFHLAQLHQIGLLEVLNRLCANKAFWLNPTTFGAIWVCYAATTAILIGLPLWLERARTAHPDVEH